jgi:predicted GNAT family acetyltransferase
MEEIKQGDNEFYVETPHGKAFLKYRIEGNNFIIYETFTPPEERGKGIATRLTNYAFDYANSKGYQIVDECSFTAHFKQQLNKS